MKWIELPELVAGPMAADLLAFAAGRPTRVFPVARPDLSGRRVSYRNLAPAELQALRCALYRPDAAHETRLWLEAIMRFCEVNLWRIERCMREIWGREAAPTLSVVTTAGLLEASLSTGDPRFLNTVLKMRETKLFPPPGARVGQGASVLALADAVDRTTMERLEACRT